jgi:hypothetical protein
LVDRTLDMGQRVGAAAAALAPMAALIQNRARARNPSVTVDAVLCEGAYARLISGNLAAHDHIVAAIFEEMIRRNYVILLAQASMARVAEGIRPAPAVPILTSPRLAVERPGQVRRVSAGEHRKPNRYARAMSVAVPLDMIAKELGEPPPLASCPCRKTLINW